MPGTVLIAVSFVGSTFSALICSFLFCVRCLRPDHKSGELQAGPPRGGPSRCRYSGLTLPRMATVAAQRPQKFSGQGANVPRACSGK